MAISGFDPTDPRVQLEVLRERLKKAEEKIRQLEGNLAQVYANLGRKETEFSLLRDEREDLRLKWELAKRDLKHIQEKSDTRKNAAKDRAFYATLILALASGLTGWGIALLTSTTPNLIGWVMIAVAVVMYYIGARFTTLLA